MSNPKIQLQNCFILLMGFPGAGKRTIGEALARKTNARFTGNHDLYDPFLKLFGDDYQAMWNLTPAMWEKLNSVQDLYLSTIANVCADSNSFIFSEMMFDKDQYHQIFYNKVLAVVKKRNAHFFPVRLICDEDELAKRVESDDRKEFSNFKTRDTELSRKRSHDEKVFYSHHENEITINNTNLSPEMVSDEIILQIKQRLI
ncbi:MAG: AAA family ATPase [Gammaproteobacteria bacterium]|nr:AAA family ATPase [Gammaproteobacteria bacterium]